MARPRASRNGKSQAETGGARGLPGDQSWLKPATSRAGKVTRRLAAKAKPSNRGEASGGAPKADEYMLQPSTQHDCWCCCGCSPGGSCAAPSCVQMTLPKASSWAGLGPAPAAKAPRTDCRTSSHATARAAGMLHLLRPAITASRTPLPIFKDLPRATGPANRQMAAAATSPSREMSVRRCTGRLPRDVSPGRSVGLRVSNRAGSAVPMSDACGRQLPPSLHRAT